MCWVEMAGGGFQDGCEGNADVCSDERWWHSDGQGCWGKSGGDQEESWWFCPIISQLKNYCMKKEENVEQ